MLSFIVRRFVSYVAMLFIAMSGVYFLASAFLDPRSQYLAMRPVPPESSIDASLSYAGINDKVSIFVRYWNWLQDIVLHWNWGYSPKGEPVNDVLWHHGWISLQVMFPATILAIVLGVGVGVYTAIRQYKPADRIWNVVSAFFWVIPSFVLALLVLLLYLNFKTKYDMRLFYVTGLSGDTVLEYLQHLALPTIVLTLAIYGTYHFTQRSYLLETINADYVRTARAKGLQKNVAIRRHALRPSLIPTAFSVALAISSMITGAVLIELIFSINGAGLYFIDTLRHNDINGAVGVAFLSAVATCVGLLLADIFVAMIDPRIRIS